MPAPTAPALEQSSILTVGFTLLEGLVTRTRCGDIDPAAVIYSD